MTDGDGLGIPCTIEYIPALLFALSKIFPLSSRTSNRIFLRHFFYRRNNDKVIYLILVNWLITYYKYLAISSHHFSSSVLNTWYSLNLFWHKF